MAYIDFRRMLHEICADSDDVHLEDMDILEDEIDTYISIEDYVEQDTKGLTRSFDLDHCVSHAPLCVSDGSVPESVAECLEAIYELEKIPEEGLLWNLSDQYGVGIITLQRWFLNHHCSRQHTSVVTTHHKHIADDTVQCLEAVFQMENMPDDDMIGHLSDQHHVDHDTLKAWFLDRDRRS